MSQESCRIHIHKEALKFSSAHMTVFPDGTKEALHGHNYTTTVSLDLIDTSLKQMVSFSEIKKEIRAICEAWDEKVLLPGKCPFFEIKGQAAGGAEAGGANDTLRSGELEFYLCDKRYVLPSEEAVLLPIDNVTSERLAEEFCRLFVERLKTRSLLEKFTGIQVNIEETPGQGATSFWRL